MPCITSNFVPTIGPIINLGFAAPGTVKPAILNQTTAQLNVAYAPILIDTGASITCISPNIVQNLGLIPNSKQSVSVPTGIASANLYLADVLISFGDPKQGAETQITENMSVMEYNGNCPHYQGLMGRDLINRGTFTISWDGRYIFCL